MAITNLIALPLLVYSPQCTDGIFLLVHCNMAITNTQSPYPFLYILTSALMIYSYQCTETKGMGHFPITLALSTGRIRPLVHSLGSCCSWGWIGGTEPPPPSPPPPPKMSLSHHSPSFSPHGSIVAEALSSSLSLSLGSSRGNSPPPSPC